MGSPELTKKLLKIFGILFLIAVVCGTLHSIYTDAMADPAETSDHHHF